MRSETAWREASGAADLVLLRMMEEVRREYKDAGLDMERRLSVELRSAVSEVSA